MLKIIVIVIVILIVGVVVYESLPVSKPEAATEQYGISVHNLNYTSVVLLKNLGVTWVRSDVGSYGWNNVYSFAKSNGFSILGILDYSSVPQNFTLQQWNQSVYHYAIEYSGVTAWEIWNEPDLQYSYDGYQNGSPYHYFNMLTSAYNIIKQVNPSAIIVALGGYVATSYTNLVWFKTLASLGIDKYSNYISVHLYPFVVNNDTTAAIQIYDTFLLSIKSITNEKVWVTETGSSQASQPSYIPAVYATLIKDGVSNIFWYDLYHTGGSVYNTALMTSFDVPDQGYYTLQSFIKS